MRIEFETDEIKTLAETADNSLPIKISLSEYQTKEKAMVVSLPKGCVYRVIIETLEV